MKLGTCPHICCDKKDKKKRSMRGKEGRGVCSLEYWGVSTKISGQEGPPKTLSLLPVLCQVPQAFPRGHASYLLHGQGVVSSRGNSNYLWQLICVPSASREETSGGHMPSPRRQMPHSVSGFLPHETEGTAILGLLSFSKEAPNPHFYVCNPDF